MGRSPSMSASSSPPAPPTTTTVGRGRCRPRRSTAEGRSSPSVTSTATAAPSGKSICRGVINGHPGKIRLCNGARHPTAKQRAHPVVGAQLVAAHAGVLHRTDPTSTWRSLLPARNGRSLGGLAMRWTPTARARLRGAHRCRPWLRCVPPPTPSSVSLETGGDVELEQLIPGAPSARQEVQGAALRGDAPDSGHGVIHRGHSVP